MKNILEKLHGLPREKNHGQDLPFVRMARIKNENLELPTASMTDGQQELLGAYLKVINRKERTAAWRSSLFRSAYPVCQWSGGGRRIFFSHISTRNPGDEILGKPAISCFLLIHFPTAQIA